jgi:putative spermidine/putrescine transport system substrate-binding protein
MDTRRVSRRRFVGVAGGGLVAATAGPFVLRHARAAGKEVVVCSWGGTYQKALRKAYFDPFEKETGIKVIDASAPEVAKVKAQVDSRNPETTRSGGSGAIPVLPRERKAKNYML